MLCWKICLNDSKENFKSKFTVILKDFYVNNYLLFNSLLDQMRVLKKIKIFSYLSIIYWQTIYLEEYEVTCLMFIYLPSWTKPQNCRLLTSACIQVERMMTLMSHDLFD